MPDTFEREIKLRMAGPGPAREALVRLGARRIRPRHFEENLLLDDRHSSLATAGKVLRLRRTDAGAVLTFKGPRQVVEGIKAREEIETAVGEPDVLEAILRGLGLLPVFRYQKYREVYEWKDVEIVLDETPVGTFIEIEGPITGIHASAAALGYSRADYVADSYVAIYLASGGKGDMVFE